MSCHSTAYLPHFLQNTPETSLQGWFWNLDSTCSCSIAVISELQNILGFIIIYCIVLFHLIKNFRKTQFIRIFSGSITKILCCRWIDLEVTLQAWKVHIDGGGINYRDATCWPQDFFFFFWFFILCNFIQCSYSEYTATKMPSLTISLDAYDLFSEYVFPGYKVKWRFKKKSQAYLMSLIQVTANYKEFKSVI